MNGSNKPAPGSSCKQKRTHNGCRKICIWIIPAARSAFFGAENNAAADPRQKPQAVYNIPCRRYDCQSCRSSRPPHIARPSPYQQLRKYRKSRRCQRRSKIFEIERFDFSAAQIHWFLHCFLPAISLIIKSRIGNRHFSLRLIRLLFPRTTRPPSEHTHRSTYRIVCQAEFLANPNEKRSRTHRRMRHAL